MSADNIVRELMTGDRDIIEDADTVHETGTLGIEARHSDETGARVMLELDTFSAFRSDSESEAPSEFDIWSTDIEPPADEGANSGGPSWLKRFHEQQREDESQ